MVDNPYFNMDKELEYYKHFFDICEKYNRVIYSVELDKVYKEMFMNVYDEIYNKSLIEKKRYEYKDFYLYFMELFREYLLNQ